MIVKKLQSRRQSVKIFHNPFNRRVKICNFVRTEVWQYDIAMYDCTFIAKSALLADYLRYIFPPETENGPLKVTTTRPTGALMVALAEPSAFPFSSMAEHQVTLELPWSRNATSAIHDRWISYSKSAMARINLALEAEFDLEFAGYYRRGEQLGIRKMDIIDAFILTRGLAATTYDALHKRVYRREQRSQERIRHKLLRKAYYINETIDFKGLEK